MKIVFTELESLKNIFTRDLRIVRVQIKHSNVHTKILSVELTEVIFISRMATHRNFSLEIVLKFCCRKQKTNSTIESVSKKYAKVIWNCPIIICKCSEVEKSLYKHNYTNPTQKHESIFFNSDNANAAQRSRAAKNSIFRYPTHT